MFRAADNERSILISSTIHYLLFTINLLTRHNKPVHIHSDGKSYLAKRSHTFLKLNFWNGSNMTEQDKATAVSNSQKNNSEPNSSDEKTRALVADYEARLDEVAQLIARVRHEINNPLTGVLGQAQLLLREELSEKARKRAQTIEELALRLRDIVAELRQVQKPLVRSGTNETRSV